MNKSIYILAAFIFILNSCQQKEEEKPVETDKKESFCLNEQLKKSTTISTISEQPIHEQLTLSGKVEYNENDLVAYKSLLQGIVTKVNFELGDYVRQGQVLAVVKSTEVQSMTQERRYYQNQIDLLRKQIQSKKELLNDGMAAQPEVSALEHELRAAQIELDKVNTTLSMYRAIGDGQFQILSPKNGYIVQKNISSGQSISNDADEALFSISNLKQVWVMVNIYASNLKYVKQGDHVKVKTVAFPDRIYTGKIDKIYNVFDDNEHVIKARVVLENQDLNLMPGLSADIIIDKENVIGTAFAIPNSAKVFENNKEYVVVYKDDCNLEVRKITPIASNAEFTYVAEKFAKNEKIITSNALLLVEELNK
ncbi:efflux RND transporter periplasmic adaptor subunit [Sphingobacterium thermophilum]|uniref:Efflux RND transporter periplasmic adaptor subunit n=1 Tax=Sphingobacterium thermophilum TaxID=768534 RepID=A0ABP8R7R7_9SPHI